MNFYAPLLKKGAYCFDTVCWSVGWSVCKASVVRSISFDPFTWSIPNLVQGLRPISRWSLLIFRSHVQRSRSNHSSQPTVLSTLYILITCLLASDVLLLQRRNLNFAPWEGGDIWYMKYFLFSLETMGPHPIPKGDVYEIVKIYWWNFKIFFFRTTW